MAISLTINNQEIAIDGEEMETLVCASESGEDAEVYRVRVAVVVIVCTDTCE